MALYKGEGPGDANALRYEGQVWSRPGPGATVRGWTFPTWSPSQQFRTLDQTARNADAVWDALPTELRAAWEAQAAAHRTWYYCPWYYYPAGNYPTEHTAMDLFRATQCARQVTGEPFTTTAPTMTTDADNDSISLGTSQLPPAPPFPLQAHIIAHWSRSAPPPSTDYVAMMWGLPRMTSPTQFNNRRDWRYITHFPLPYSTQIQLDTYLTRHILFWSGSLITLQFGIAERGCAPFTVCHATVRNAA